MRKPAADSTNRIKTAITIYKTYIKGLK